MLKSVKKEQNVLSFRFNVQPELKHQVSIAREVRIRERLSSKQENNENILTYGFSLRKIYFAFFSLLAVARNANLVIFILSFRVVLEPNVEFFRLVFGSRFIFDMLTCRLPEPQTTVS